MDIYIEPVLSAPRLVIFGVSPAAQALARLAKSLGYRVEAVDPQADRTIFPEVDRLVTDLNAPELGHKSQQELGPRFAVVATLGQSDEDAIRAALSLEPAYLGVVASRKRLEQLAETLAVQGVAPESLARIRSPAGFDIGAVTPEEISLSILTEIVQVDRARSVEPKPAGAPEASAYDERDPVCGMPVLVAAAHHRADFARRTYYFCCGTCRERFLAEPERYALASDAGGAA